MPQESLEDVKQKLVSYQIREKIAAIFCLTTIALVSIVKLSDPENIIINIVVAIAGFVAGAASRQTDTVNKTV
jgi:hypothetical protein